ADEHREHRPDADAGGPDEGNESIDEPGCGRDGQSDRERVEPEVALEDAEPGLHDQSQSHTADGAVDERADRAHPLGADAHAGEHPTDDSAEGQGQPGDPRPAPEGSSSDSGTTSVIFTCGASISEASAPASSPAPSAWDGARPAAAA